MHTLEMRSLGIFIFSVLHFVVSERNSTLDRYGRIYNPIIQLVNFPNDPCTGSTTSLTGICYSTEDCSGVSGGYADGKCAQGFGVCCVIRWEFLVDFPCLLLLSLIILFSAECLNVVGQSPRTPHISRTPPIPTPTLTPRPAPTLSRSPAWIFVTSDYSL